jgi:hypothetical protein
MRRRTPPGATGRPWVLDLECVLVMGLGGRPRTQAGVSASARAVTALASSPVAASASARSAPISIRLPARSWAFAVACSRSSSASASAGWSWASRTRASTRCSRSVWYIGSSSMRRPLSCAQRAAAAMSPWASSRRARCAGTGLNRLASDGLGAIRSASAIASRAPPGSPLACRIHASVTRAAASGWVFQVSCRHSSMPLVTCCSAVSSSPRW